GGIRPGAQCGAPARSLRGPGRQREGSGMTFPFLPDVRRIRWAALLRIWGHFGDLVMAERRAFLLSVVGTLGVTAAEILQPWPLKVLFDYVLLGKNGKGWWAPVAEYIR